METKPPPLQAKEFMILSSKYKKDGYEGYDLKCRSNEGSWEFVKGVLDNGAQTNCGPYDHFKDLCTDVHELKNKVMLKSWNETKKVRATHMGTLRGLRVYYADKNYEMRKYTFQNLSSQGVFGSFSEDCCWQSLQCCVGTPFWFTFIEERRISSVELA